MFACTFFGHRDCPASIRPKLRAALTELIEEQGVDRFYVGRQGNFDAMARGVLRELAETYPHIRYSVVLERLPGERRDGGDLSDTIFPEELEGAPPRWAISRRNEWMLERSDFAVTWITRTWGGAARFAARAERRQKRVIPLAGPEKAEKKA